METKPIPSCGETRRKIAELGVLKTSRLLGQPFETVAKWANGWDIPAIIRKRLWAAREGGNEQ